MEIVIFTGKGCGNCMMQKKIFDSNNISYTEHDCEIRKDLCEKLKITTIPTMLINNKLRIEGLTPLAVIKRKLQ